jgi:RHS repeat-associated protein
MQHASRSRSAVNGRFLWPRLVAVAAALPLVPALASIPSVASSDPRERTRPAGPEGGNRLGATREQRALAAIVARSRPGDEIEALRTANSRTYVGRNGTLVARFAAGSLNYATADGWRAINNDLTAAEGDGYALRNRANRYRVELPDRLEDRPVRVASGAGTMSFKLRGARGAPVARGNVARYAGALRGVTVRYAAYGDSVKEELVVSSPRALRRFVFDLSTSDGLTPRANRAGGVDLLDRDGALHASIPAPVAYPDGRPGAARSAGVSLRLRRSATGYVLSLDPDRRWFARHARRWPMVIDPSIFYADPGCYIVGGTSSATNFCTSDTLEVGANGGAPRRALLRFASLPRSPFYHVLNAELKLRVLPGSSTGSTTVDVHRLTRTPTSAMTWQTSDGTTAWQTPGGDFDASRSAENTQAGASNDAYWGLTELVQSWMDGSATNHGLLVKARDETRDHVLALGSPRHATSTYRPELQVEYQFARVGERPEFSFHDFRVNDQTMLRVNLGNGNLLVKQRELRVVGTGLDLELGHYWNGQDGDFAWDMDIEGSGVSLAINRDGSARFRDVTGESVHFRHNGDGTYTAPQSSREKLTKNGDGTYRVTLNHSEARWHFAAGGGRATAYEDRNGNRIRDFRSFWPLGSNGERWQVTDTQDRVTTAYAYKNSSAVGKVTDPAGRSVSFGYTSDFALASFTDATGRITKYAYRSGDFRLVEIEDPRRNRLLISYDAGYRPTSITQVTDTGDTGPTTRFAYYSGSSACPSAADVAGYTLVTDPNGNETTHCWDRRARIVEVKDALGHRRSATYTATSNVERYTATSGAETTFGYDGSDRPRTSTSPATGGNQAAVRRFDYNAGNASFRADGYTDAQGNTMSYAYTTKGNIRELKEATSIVPQVTLDYNDGESGEADNGTVRSSTDGRGNKTTYEYDAKGNLLKVNPPANAGLGSTTYTYDAISRITSITDGKGQKRSVFYDALDRPTKYEFRNAAGALVRTHTYSYDANGNVLSRVDGSGTYNYAYDKLNRLIEESRPGHPTTLYAYDGASNLTSLTHAGEQIVYGYNAVNLVETIREPETAATTTITYDDDNRRNTTTFPNGVVDDVDHDRAGRPIRIKASKGIDVLTHFEYDYTKPLSGQATETDLRSKQIDHRRGTTTTYAYDALNRLRRADTSGSASSAYVYDYDNASNRTSVTRDGSVTTFAYGTANQLCWRVAGSSAAGCGSPPAGATTYTYDANGNLTGSNAGLSIAYNELNQTTSHTAGGATHSFAYAGDNQIERTQKNSVSYADTVLGLSSEVSGASTRYVRDDRGELVGLRRPNGSATSRYYYLRDVLGSVVAVTDQNGAVSNRYVYEDPYGEQVTTSGTVPNPWRFAGAYFDAETGLYKIGARYYAPTQARWTQRDPVGQPLSPREANGYTYVGGDPVNLTDPLGTDIVDWAEDRWDDATDWTEENLGLSGEEVAGFGFELGVGMAICATPAAAACIVGNVGIAVSGVYDAWDDNDDWWYYETSTGS